MDKLYFGQTDRTALGKFWVAVSDLGLAAVEWGLNRVEFEAYLSKRFKRTVEFSPDRILEACNPTEGIPVRSEAGIFPGHRLGCAAPIPAVSAACHMQNSHTGRHAPIRK